MSLSPTTLTAQNYTELQRAYDPFNQVLFDDALPACLTTLQREKRTCGYFSHQRFADLDGLTTGEIALNPAFFAAFPWSRPCRPWSTKWCTCGMPSSANQAVADTTTPSGRTRRRPSV
jgi:hypothetical protein